MNYTNSAIGNVMLILFSTKDVRAEFSARMPLHCMKQCLVIFTIVDCAP